MGTAWIVFAKEPTPGEVKTRLTPPLTGEQAATLYTAFVEDTCETVAAAAREGERRVLAAASEPGLGLRRIAKEHELALVTQSGDNLGTRMARAISVELDLGATSVILVGSDSPTMPREALEDAARLLAEKSPRVVLGPARDGGYWLIGASGRVPDLFAGIPWSTGGVLTATLERARERDVELALVRQWYDVDDADGLRHLDAQLSQTPPGLSPRTRAAVAACKAAAPQVFRGGD